MSITRLLFLILIFTLSFSSANAAKTNLPKIGDYLVANISSNSNDYKITKRYYQKLHRSNPNDLLALDRLLLLSILDGDLYSANNYSFKLAQAGCDKKVNSCCMNNQSPQGHLVNGISYLNSYKQGFADQSFASIWRGEISDSTFVRLLRAWVWADSPSLDKSMALIDLISSDDHQYLTLVHKALIYDFANKIELAEIFYEQSLSMQNDLYVMQLYLNFLNRNNLVEEKNNFVSEYLSDYDDAFIEKFTKSNNNRIIQNPLQGIGIVLFNAQSLIKNVNQELSHMLFQLALETSPNMHEIKYIFATFLSQTQDQDKARDILSLIPKTHYLGHFAAIQISETYSYEDESAKAINNLRNFSESEENFEIFLSLGNFYRYEKDWDNAIKSYRAALDLGEALDKDNLWEVYFNIGIVHERTKNWKLAEQNFINALELYEEQPDVLNYLGYSYIDMDQNLSTAKEMIEKAISLKPNDPYIIDSLAWYYYKVGQYEDALSLLEFSIDMMPYDPTVNDHYGDVLWMLGNEIQARYYWKKAIELDIDEPLQEKIRRKLLKGI